MWGIFNYAVRYWGCTPVALLHMCHLFCLFPINSLSCSSVMLLSSTFFCSVPAGSHFCPFLFNTAVFIHWSHPHPVCSHLLLTSKIVSSSSLSLLVVPVNGHVDLKTNLTPPLITHTAATPMPVPKLPVGGDPILGYESRRGSNVSVDPACYDKSPVRMFILTYTKCTWQSSKPALVHVWG